MNTTRPIA